jgi:hypothetical protein
MTRNAQSRNNPDDHPVSAAAYVIEETYVNVHYLVTNYEDDFTPNELKVLKQIEQRLTSLYANQSRKHQEPVTASSPSPSHTTKQPARRTRRPK